MSVTNRITRPLLASIFVTGGVDALRKSEEEVKAAEAVVRPLTERFSALLRDTETFLRFNAAVQIGGGALLALGRVRRIAALALIGSLFPTTYAGHRFWEEVDEERQIQRIHFLKNFGLLGGLVSTLGADHRGAQGGRKTGHRS
jgi:uncharacterized membrane protein YphA (DoxX/SURF4 family)